MPAYVPAPLPPTGGSGCTGLEQTHKCALTILTILTFTFTNLQTRPDITARNRLQVNQALPRYGPMFDPPADCFISGSGGLLLRGWSNGRFQFLGDPEPRAPLPLLKSHRQVTLF